jgi:AraC-like DNA-binding protein
MTVIAIRSADFDERHRVAEFQNVAANICGLHISPRRGAEYRSETVIGVLPGAVMANTHHSSCTTERDRGLAAATGDNVLVHIPLAGGFVIRQQGGESIECRPGQVYLDPTEATGIAEFTDPASHVFYISLPRNELRAGTTGLNRSLREGAALTPQWRMLLAYARSLHAELPNLPAADRALYAGHIRDLALIALEAEGDQRRHAEAGGQRAARLAAIKSDVEQHLHSEDLTIGWIARRHGISERYVRALFAAEDTSFRDFVADRRLLGAHRLLADPGHRDMSVHAIALAMGFGDLSSFNARFKRLFGATPSDVRRLAHGET